MTTTKPSVLDGSLADERDHRGTYTGSLACVRCGATVGEDLAFGGCRACVAAGYGANVLPVYRLTPGPLGPD